MPHHDIIEVSGRVRDVFAHRFVIETATGGTILADLGPKGAEAFTLALGADVVAEGEMKPSELKVGRIGLKGGTAIVIAHKPKSHSPKHDRPGHHRDDPAAKPDVAMKAVRKAGFEPLGAPRRKPKHFEVLGRKGEAFVECHVEFDGRIRKEKTVSPQDDKWSDAIRDAA